MTKRLLVVLSILALFVGGSVTASDKYGWNPEKGKKLFIAKVKKRYCKKLTIKKFTQAHTQKEWKGIITSGGFEAEFIKLCPDFGKNNFTEKQIANLGDAAINYARDSYNIPS